MLHVWTWVPLLFQPCPLISSPASPGVRKRNLHMQYTSSGNRKPQELKGRMYTRTKKESRFIVFGIETQRHIMNIHQPSQDNYSRYWWSWQCNLAPSHQTTVRLTHSRPAAPEQSGPSNVFHPSSKVCFISLRKKKKKIIYIQDSSVTNNTQIFRR